MLPSACHLMKSGAFAPTVAHGGLSRPANVLTACLSVTTYALLSCWGDCPRKLCNGGAVHERELARSVAVWPVVACDKGILVQCANDIITVRE